MIQFDANGYQKVENESKTTSSKGEYYYCFNIWITINKLIDLQLYNWMAKTFRRYNLFNIKLELCIRVAI